MRFLRTDLAAGGSSVTIARNSRIAESIFCRSVSSALIASSAADLSMRFTVLHRGSAFNERRSIRADAH